MARNIGVINEPLEFDEVTQYVPIDTYTDAFIINIKNKHDEDKNPTNNNGPSLKPKTDQIYVAQVIDGKNVYINLAKGHNTTQGLSAEVFTSCGFNNKDQMQADANDTSNVNLNDYENYEDFNCIKVYDYEPKGKPETRDKDVSINVGNEFEGLKAMLDEKLFTNRSSLTKSYGEMGSAVGLRAKHNIVHENGNKTKGLPANHNFVGSVDSTHNIDEDAIDQTNQGSCNDVNEIKVLSNGIGDYIFNEINTDMINEKMITLGNFNETADEKSLISDDISFNNTNNCNGFDEIKYRFKGPVFRSFCEKKKKRNWKSRSFGGELKLVLQV